MGYKPLFDTLQVKANYVNLEPNQAMKFSFDENEFESAFNSTELYAHVSLY